LFDVFEWGDTKTSAQLLSRAILETVMVVKYFDDDYVEFAPYASHKYLENYISRARMLE